VAYFQRRGPSCPSVVRVAKTRCPSVFPDLPSGRPPVSFFRRECSWEPPPEATLESPSWASWSTQTKGGEPSETPSSQGGELLTASAETVNGTDVVDEGAGGIAPREGVVLGGGDVDSSRRKDGSSAVVSSAMFGEAAAGSDGSFHGPSTGKSGMPTGSEKLATDAEVWDSLKTELLP